MSENPLPIWYLQWVKHHITAFSLNKEASEAMLKWGAVFIRLFTASELREATDELIGRPMGLDWIREHRAAIIDCITSARNRTKEKQRQDRYSVCAFCSDTGACIVPHPGLEPGTRWWRRELLMPVEDPKGLTRTVAVACCCEIGRRSANDEDERGRPWMTLTTYELRYPNYREVAAERESVLKAMNQEPIAADYENLNRIIGTMGRV